MMERFKVWCKEQNEWEKHQVVIDSSGNLFHMLPGRWIPLRKDNHVVCWSSGKFDKKGNEIYHGSILRWYPNRPKNHIDVVVELDDDGFCFGNWYDNNYPDTRTNSLVVGNIFENEDMIP